MKVLGIDTTTKFLCLGVYDDGKIYEYAMEVGHKLSMLLDITVRRVLESLGWEPGDVDYFACGLGPGSFTGIRVWVSAIKGLAWALKKPVIGLVTLDILATNIRPGNSDTVVAVDAKRNLIYTAIYKNTSAGLKKQGPYMLLSLDEFCRKVRTGSCILGDGAGLYRQEMLKRIKGARILEKDYWYPGAANLIGLALEKIKAKKIQNAFDVKPVYLYPKECQIKKVTMSPRHKVTR